MTTTNYQLQQICFAWRNKIIKDQFTHYVTFIFNISSMDPASAHRMLNKFAMEIDRKLYGKKYTKKPRAERTSFTAFPEHLHSNLHFHAALTTPAIHRFNCHARDIWLEIVSQGDLDIQQKDFTKQDTTQIATYITKDAWLRENQEAIFISRSNA